MKYNYYKPSSKIILFWTFVGSVAGFLVVTSVLIYCFPSLMPMRTALISNALFFPFYTTLFAWSNSKDIDFFQARKRTIIRVLILALYIGLVGIVSYLNSL
jgi:hypothetical protein